MRNFTLTMQKGQTSIVQFLIVQIALCGGSCCQDRDFEAYFCCIGACFHVQYQRITGFGNQMLVHAARCFLLQKKNQIQVVINISMALLLSKLKLADSLTQWSSSENLIGVAGLGFSVIVAVWASSNLIGVTAPESCFNQNNILRGFTYLLQQLVCASWIMFLSLIWTSNHAGHRQASSGTNLLRIHRNTIYLGMSAFQQSAKLGAKTLAS